MQRKDCRLDAVADGALDVVAAGLSSCCTVDFLEALRFCEILGNLSSRGSVGGRDRDRVFGGIPRTIARKVARETTTERKRRAITVMLRVVILQIYLENMSK